MGFKRQRVQALIVALCAVLAQPASAAKPNIVIYLGDDIGSGLVNQHAPEWSFADDPTLLHAIPQVRRIQTPTLERMAREGKRMLRSYSSSPVCGPARHSLMTGISAGMQHVRGNGFGEDSTDVDIEPGRTTIAAVLKTQNYRTFAVGKWGMATGADASGSPCRQGFDGFFGKFTHESLGEAFPRTIEGCTADGLSATSTKFPQNEDASQDLCRLDPSPCAYFDFEIRARALQFIDESAATQQPWFLYWATTAGHNSLYEDVKNRHNKRSCTLKTHPVPTNGRYTREALLDAPGSNSREVRGLMAMMEYTVDEDMRQLLDTLARHGMTNDTLVIVASDNGAHAEAYADASYDPHLDLVASAGLRGIKRRLYEGGVRSPTLVWWPGTVPAGTTSSYPFMLYDLPLTLAGLAAVPDDSDALEPLRAEGSGVALGELLLAQSDMQSAVATSATRAAVYTEMCFVEDARFDFEGCPRSWTLFRGCGFGLYDLSEWPQRVLKLVQNEPRGAIELYDVTADPFETTDLATTLPARVARLSLLRTELRTPSCPVEDAYEPFCYDDPCNLHSGDADACSAETRFACDWTSGTKVCASPPSAGPSLQPSAAPVATLRPSQSPSRAPLTVAPSKAPTALQTEEGPEPGTGGAAEGNSSNPSDAATQQRAVLSLLLAPLFLVQQQQQQQL